MVVKVINGGPGGKIGIPFLIFHPILGVPNNIRGVYYRSAKKGFMTELLAGYYKEPHVSFSDPRGRTKIQWMDNAPGHKILPRIDVRALESIRTVLRHFPQNSTHLTQPAPIAL